MFHKYLGHGGNRCPNINISIREEKSKKLNILALSVWLKISNSCNSKNPSLNTDIQTETRDSTNIGIQSSRATTMPSKQKIAH